MKKDYGHAWGVNVKRVLWAFYDTPKMAVKNVLFVMDS